MSRPDYTLDDSGDRSFTTLLDQSLGIHFEVIDVGVPGSLLREWGKTMFQLGSLVHRWPTQIEPWLQKNTGKTIDLVVMRLGINEPFSFFGRSPSSVPGELSEHASELIAEGVKKVVILGPWAIGDAPGDWSPAWHYQQQQLYCGLFENWPVGVDYLPLYHRFDPFSDMDQTFLGWVYLLRRILLNQLGHFKLTVIARRHIRQMLYKKPMRWPGSPPFRDDTSEEVSYPPHWYLNE